MPQPQPSRQIRSITLLGSTGSVGTQTLELLARHPDRYRLHGLAAGGRDVATLAQQAIDHRATVVAVADVAGAEAVRSALAQRGGTGIEVFAGPQAATQLAAQPTDMVVNAITGAAGLHPTLAALHAGTTLALANKESLIIGGQLVKQAARPGQLVPVDSEHSALAQCLRAGQPDQVRRLVLTASGGPFRGCTREQLASVTPQQALAHPTWSMGKVITTNSATMVNKGLEVIEAHLLFDVPLDDIAVVVHPQSMVHSWVEFVDGACILQASPPDMRLPIAVALGWPDERIPQAAAPVDITTAAAWEFLPFDEQAFPAVRLARQVGAAGGSYPAVYNAANEECVHAFHAGRIGFLEILQIIERAVQKHEGSSDIVDVAHVLAADAWARAFVNDLLADR